MLTEMFCLKLKLNVRPFNILQFKNKNGKLKCGYRWLFQDCSVEASLQMYMDPFIIQYSEIQSSTQEYKNCLAALCMKLELSDH